MLPFPGDLNLLPGDRDLFPGERDLLPGDRSLPAPGDLDLSLPGGRSFCPGDPLVRDNDRRGVMERPRE